MDHARAFRLLEQLGAAGGRADLLRAAMEAVGAESASFHEPGATQASQAAAVETPAEILTRYLKFRSRYERSNRPMFVALERGPAIDGDVYSARERERLAVYDEVFRPQGVRSMLASWLSVRGARLGVLVLKRHSAAFCAEDASRLARLAPVLALAEAALRLPAPASTSWSRREEEVAELAARGLRNAEIAAVLGTSVGTVKKQMRSAMEKAGASNRAELASLLARRN